MTRRVEFFRHTLGAAELDSLEQTLGSVFLTLGPRVGQFEQRLADYLEVEHVVGLSSCSMALLLALRVAGIGPGDEVITTPMTFVATTNAVLHAGATPVFADIQADTGLIDPVRVEAAITPRTRAILSVGLYGQLADLEVLRSKVAAGMVRKGGIPNEVFNMAARYPPVPIKKAPPRETNPTKLANRSKLRANRA